MFVTARRSASNRSNVHNSSKKHILDDRTQIQSFQPGFCITMCQDMIVLLFEMLWGDLWAPIWFLASKICFFEGLCTFGSDLRGRYELPDFRVFEPQNSDNIIPTGSLHHNVSGHDSIVFWNALGRSLSFNMVPGFQNLFFRRIVHNCKECHEYSLVFRSFRIFDFCKLGIPNSMLIQLFLS